MTFQSRLEEEKEDVMTEAEDKLRVEKGNGRTKRKRTEKEQRGSTVEKGQWKRNMTEKEQSKSITEDGQELKETASNKESYSEPTIAEGKEKESVASKEHSTLTGEEGQKEGACDEQNQSTEEEGKCSMGGSLNEQSKSLVNEENEKKRREEMEGSKSSAGEVHKVAACKERSQLGVTEGKGMETNTAITRTGEDEKGQYTGVTASTRCMDRTRLLLMMLARNEFFLQMHSHYTQIYAQSTLALKQLEATLASNRRAINKAIRKRNTRRRVEKQREEALRKETADVAVATKQAAVTHGITASLLSDCPKSLHCLWNEWEVGDSVHGKKPAKFFTPEESNSVIAEYSLRKRFWDLMIKMIDSGYTTDEAIKMIHEVYGFDSSVSTILRQLARDGKKHGPNWLHPDLKVDSDFRKEKIPVLARQAPALVTTAWHTPPSLSLLWKEYDEGLDGRKPAKLFTAQERGKVKYVYCRRKIFWIVVEKMMNQYGHTPDEAIEKIEQVYGHNLAVSTLLVKMRCDKVTYPEGIPHPVLGVDFSLPSESKKSPHELPAFLSRRPYCLSLLWREYIEGINGCKAAKDFTLSERGREKFLYSRRKIFWDVAKTMIESGYTSEEAIKMIHHLYGRHSSISDLLTYLRADKKKYPDGMHPCLKIDSEFRKKMMPELSNRSMSS